MQVAKYSPRVLPDRASAPRPTSDGEKQPTDDDLDACMKLYRDASNLRSSGRTMPGTNKPYPCVGMAPICRKYEQDNGLPENSIKDRTLRRFDTRVFYTKTRNATLPHNKYYNIVLHHIIGMSNTTQVSKTSHPGANNRSCHRGSKKT